MISPALFLFIKIQFSCTFLSNSLQSHGLQRARLPCASPTPKGYSNSCPSRWWCYPTISSPVIPLFSCLQSFPASASFPVSQVFASGGQIIGVSASSLVLPMTIQDWFPLGWIGWISFSVQGTLKTILQHHSSKSSVLWHWAFFIIQLSLLYMTTGKTIALTRWTFVGKVMSLLFNMLSRLVIAFLPRSKCLLISWLQSPSAVIWSPQRIKSFTVSNVSPFVLVLWKIPFVFQ